MVKWTRSVAIFTLLLAIVSAASNFFIYKQWRASVDAQTDTREQLRAVVSQSGINVIGVNFKDGKATRYAFFVTFTNFGSTRTNSFKAWDSVHYFEGEVPNNQDFTRPYTRIENMGDGIVGPNSTIQLSPVTLEASDVDKVIAKSGVAVIWGHVEWSDIFNPNVTHPINFCVYAVPQQIPDNGPLAFTPSPVKADCNSSS